MLTLSEWIKSLGGPAKAAELTGEKVRTVQSWTQGEKIPRPQTVHRIIQLSKGRLDFNSVYADLFARQAVKQAKALIKKGARSE